jgi:hypothetical protein
MRVGDWRGQLSRWACLGAGVLPWLVALALYHQAFTGDYRWTGQHFWGAPQTFPVFSPKYLTRDGFLAVHDFAEPAREKFDGNFVAHGMTLLSQADMTLTFSRLHNWGPPWKTVYQWAIASRSWLGLLGMAVCWWWWRRNGSAFALVNYTVALTLITFAVFGYYWWQEERYFLRVVPLFALLNAVGAVWLWKKLWNAPRLIRFTGMILPVVLVLTPMAVSVYVERNRIVVTSDDNLNLYEAFRNADTLMESNAVVISTYEPFRPDIFFVRGKQRESLPLSRDRGGCVVYPHRHAPGVTPYSFSALERFDLVQAWMANGRPVYLMLREPLDSGGYPPEFFTLQSLVQLQPLASIQNGTSVVPYFFKVLPNSPSIQLTAAPEKP